MKTLLLSLCSLTLLSLSYTTHAHHSWASIFDAKGDVEIEGVVTKILWRNPHIQFQLTVDQGKDRNRLIYTQVVVDPLMLKIPSVAQKWWQHVPGKDIQPYDCAGAI